MVASRFVPELFGTCCAFARPRLKQKELSIARISGEFRDDVSKKMDEQENKERRERDLIVRK